MGPKHSQNNAQSEDKCKINKNLLKKIKIK